MTTRRAPDRRLAATEGSRGAEEARDLAALLMASPRWLHRCSERIRFHDDATVSRRVLVELSVVAEMPRLPDGTRLVPVAVLDKRPLPRFSVSDEEGRALPVLTTTENLRLARAAVAAAAGRLLDGRLPSAVAADLEAVVTARRRAGAALGRLWGARDHRAVRRRLRQAAGGVFAALVGALAEGFLVVACLDASPGARRVLTVTHDQPVIYPPTGARQWLTRRVGWSPTAVRFPVRTLLAGRSAHLELQVPAGVDVDQAVAVRRRRSAGGKDQAAVVARAGDAPHVHLHLGRLVASEAVEVRVWLRADPHGWVGQSAWAATGVAAALAASGWRLAALVGSPASAEAASLLLGLTGLAATLLVRPREHRLATRLLAGLRRLAVLPPVAAATAAGMLVIGPGRPLLDVVWGALAVVCAGVATVLHIARSPPPALRGRDA